VERSLALAPCRGGAKAARPLTPRVVLALIGNPATRTGFHMNQVSVAASVLALITFTTPAGETAAPLPFSELLAAAQTILDTCKSSGYAVTVTVLDADFSTRLVLRGDGAPGGTVEIGRRKAYTVIKTGISSGEFGKTVPKPAAAASSQNPGASGGPPMPGPVNGDPNLITWAGGLPIRVHGVLVGAMSASGAPGGDKDEACVTAGLAKIAGAAMR
jgi:uncharacterized protein GlcG (DUF336 family)